MKIIFFIFLIPALVFGDWNQLFSENNDPTIFQNVNVISGNLIVNFHDIRANGAVATDLTRSYSSNGALEHSRNKYDLLLNELHEGWKVGGGWSLLPHVGLLIEGSITFENIKAYVFEKSGSLISFEFDKFENKKKEIIIFKPIDEGYFSYGYLSGNTNPKNYKLIINFDNYQAVLELPDGTQRNYSSKYLGLYRYRYDDDQNDDTPYDRFIRTYYRIDFERLPSGHILEYSYDERFHLKNITAKNPLKNKIFSVLNFDVYYSKLFLSRLYCKSSTEQSIDYRFIKHENRAYLKTVTASNKPIEANTVIPARKGIGLRANTFFIDDKEQLFVNYYSPLSLKDERQWHNNPNSKPFHIDKVKDVNRKLEGKRVRLAAFSYHADHTDVRDVENLLIRFYHDSKKLLKIEYFDQDDKLHSIQKFFWEDNSLKYRAKLNSDKTILFAKSFSYDERGNVTKEVFFGNLTGKAVEEIKISDSCVISGGESLVKKYIYYPGTNLLKEEREENGLKYVFSYLPKTNLLSAKLTYLEEKVIAREYFEYNADMLLERVIKDDGNSSDANDLLGISQRKLIEYALAPKTGLKLATLEAYWDFKKCDYVKILTEKFKYSPKNQIIETAIYDANDDYHYTLYTEYDQFGNIVKKTNPNGQANTYKYDKFGNLIETKEIGSEPKKFKYDLSNNLIETEAVYSDEKQSTEYDLKGRQVQVKDFKGHITTSKYDCFGNRLQAKFPTIKNTEAPLISCQYDTFGNLITSIDAKNVITQSSYNVYGKPIKIIYPDSAEITHTYNKDGTISKVILQDKTVVTFEYDFLKRLIAKKIFSKELELLSSEKWVYNFFHLISHTNSTNLTTNYRYDGAGRKIELEQAGIKTTFFYDELGFNTRVQTEDVFTCKDYDVGGRLLKQWEEDLAGNIKNRTVFCYNEENRIVKAKRLTSKGLVTDYFDYDQKARITYHSDPEGAITRYIYEDNFVNELSEVSQRTTIIDPLGNKTIKTENLNGKIISCIKKDSHNKTVFAEKYEYDISGNLICRISSIYKKDQPENETIVKWKYDSMDRVIEEAESDEKITSFKYDLKGRLIQKTFPNGIRLEYIYDGLDRIIAEITSDGILNHRYTYKLGSYPVEYRDINSNTVVYRKYNKFNLIEEELDANGYKMSFEYDALNRCSLKILPDGSSIVLSYEGLYMRSIKRLNPEKELLYEHIYDSFDPNGHVHKESLINNLGSVKTYHDKLERPIIQESTWASQSVKYNKLGLVDTQQNSLLENKNYQYDALNQITQENNVTYCFDSLGNPGECKINNLNQIIENPKGESFSYDLNGSLIEKVLTNQTIQYQYDSLSRLKSIIYPNKQKVVYEYDPLTRLSSKTSYQFKNSQFEEIETIFFLYDQDVEIGLIDQSANLKQLKVLGLGIQKDIGAAVAIELNGKTYAPLHDFSGNIIAIISSDGKIAEKYPSNAFGQENDTTNYINPWRFCSKRFDNDLVFFGIRFYDPTLQRWLTPDPAGFSDGANLYVYVLNSPINRLDLFGLNSEPLNGADDLFNITILTSWRDPGFQTYLTNGTIDGIHSDFVISCGHFHQLEFSPQEQQAGKANLMDHLADLMPKNSNEFSLVSVGNGIDTRLTELKQMHDEVFKEVSGTLSISLYNPSNVETASNGFISKILAVTEDIKRTKLEQDGQDTPIVRKMRQFIALTSEKMSKINPNALWIHFPHSENGVIVKRSLENMTPEQKKTLNKMFHIFALGPAEPISKKEVFMAENIYSEEDLVTLRYAAPFMNQEGYNIKIVPCISNFKEKSLYIADHKFLGSTYREQWTKKIKDLDDKIGFYRGEKHAQSR